MHRLLLQRKVHRCCVDFVSEAESSPIGDGADADVSDALLK